MKKDYSKNVYCLLLRDGDCFGLTGPMNKAELDEASSKCLSLGYDVSCVDMTALFENRSFLSTVVLSSNSNFHLFSEE